MDVAVWLRSLGLEQYEALFPENDIDAEVLVARVVASVAVF